jgi:invasion protein IalB
VQGIPALMPPGAAMPTMGGMPMSSIVGAGIDGHPAVAGGAVTGAAAAAAAAAAATAASTPAMLLDDHGSGTVSGTYAWTTSCAQAHGRTC